MSQSGHKTTIIASVILAAGIALAGWLISSTLYKARMANNKVTVKGLAEREVLSNMAIWTLGFTVTGADLRVTQQQASQNQDVVVGFFKEMGFKPENILIGSTRVRDLMADAYNQARIAPSARYIVEGDVTVRTNNVKLVAKSVPKTSKIIHQGVVLTANNNPVYKFTTLNNVKPDMLRDATRNAREAAKKFAEDSQTEVMGISSAQQGYFTISGADGFEYQGDASMNKKLRVVTTVTFYLGE